MRACARARKRERERVLWMFLVCLFVCVCVFLSKLIPTLYSVAGITLSKSCYITMFGWFRSQCLFDLCFHHHGMAMLSTHTQTCIFILVQRKREKRSVTWSVYSFTARIVSLSLSPSKALDKRWWRRRRRLWQRQQRYVWSRKTNTFLRFPISFPPEITLKHFIHREVYMTQYQKECVHISAHVTKTKRINK